MRAAEADSRSFSNARRCMDWNSVPEAWNSRDSFCWVYFCDACLQRRTVSLRGPKEQGRLDLASYAQILPRRQLFDALADFFESIPSLF